MDPNYQDYLSWINPSEPFDALDFMGHVTGSENHCTSGQVRPVFTGEEDGFGFGYVATLSGLFNAMLTSRPLTDAMYVDPERR